MQHAPVGHQGHVVAFAYKVGLAKWHGVQLLRHFALQAVEHLVFEEDHRVVVADRLDQHALGVIGRGRAHHLQARDVRPHRGEHLRMLGRGTQAGAVHGAHHQRRGGLAAEHVAELSGLVEQLVEAAADKVDEHQLAHRAHAPGGGAHGHAHVTDFRQRRIQHALGELRVQALGHPSTPPQASCSPGAPVPPDTSWPMIKRSGRGAFPGPGLR